MLADGHGPNAIAVFCLVTLSDLGVPHLPTKLDSGASILLHLAQMSL